MRARVKKTGKLIDVRPSHYIGYEITDECSIKSTPMSYRAIDIVLESESGYNNLVGESYNDLCIKEITNKVSAAIIKEIREQLKQK